MLLVWWCVSSGTLAHQVFTARDEAAWLHPGCPMSVTGNLGFPSAVRAAQPVLPISGLGLPALETNRAPSTHRLADKVMGIRGKNNNKTKPKKKEMVLFSGCRACLSRLPVYLLSADLLQSIQRGPSATVGAAGISVALWWPSSSSPSKQPSAICGAVAQPEQRGNNTPSVESAEQNKALMKLLQAFQMPVHINVLLGSAQSAMRLGGSQPGNRLSFSSPFPAQCKSLRTQGCSAGCAAGCQKGGGEPGFIFM